MKIFKSQIWMPLYQHTEATKHPNREADIHKQNADAEKEVEIKLNFSRILLLF